MKTFSITTIYAILLISLLTNCVAAIENDIGAKNTLNPIPTVFSQMTPSPKVKYEESPTATIAAQPYLTSINQRCVNKSSAFTFQSDDKALVFDRILPGIPNQLSMVNLRDGEVVEVDKAYSLTSVSPDFSKFAYVDSAHRLVISDSSLKDAEKFSGSENWWGVVDWVDNQNLTIQNMPQRNGALNPPASVILFNLLNNNQTEYLPDYPEIVTLEGGVPNWGKNAFTLAVYNSLFSRVLYPAWNNNDDGPIILYNTQGENVILRLHGNDYDYGGGPQWYKDGSAFVVAVFPTYISWKGNIYKNFTDNLPYKGGYELALISSEGDIKRLTYLTQTDIAAEEGISLSPNNSKVAFWLNLDYKPADINAIRQLALLDISSGEITNLCLEGGDFPNPPIWSADEKYLLVTVSSATRNESLVYLVDIVNAQARIIAENAVATGWLTK